MLFVQNGVESVCHKDIGFNLGPFCGLSHCQTDKFHYGPLTMMIIALKIEKIRAHFFKLQSMSILAGLNLFSNNKTGPLFLDESADAKTR